jgi:hypothetical protein
MDTASASVLSEGNTEVAGMREEGREVREHNDSVRQSFNKQISDAKAQEKDDAGSEAKKKTYLEQGAELAGQVGGRARAVSGAMTKARSTLDPLGQGLEKAGVSGGEYAKAAFGQYMNDSETAKAGKAVYKAGQTLASGAGKVAGLGAKGMAPRQFGGTFGGGQSVGRVATAEDVAQSTPAPWSTSTRTAPSSGAAAQSGGESGAEAASRGAPEGAVLTGRATDLGVGSSGRLAKLQAQATGAGAKAGGSATGAATGGAEAAGDVGKLGKLAGYADVAARGMGIVQGGIDFIDDFDSHGHFQVKGNTDQKLGNEMGMASGALDVASFFVPGAGLVAAGLGIASAIETIRGDKKADETKAEVTLPGKEKAALQSAPIPTQSVTSEGLVGHAQQQATQKTGGASGAF